MAGGAFSYSSFFFTPFSFLFLVGNLLCLSVGLLLMVSSGAPFYHLLDVWGGGVMMLEKSVR
ncbi:hypothetical protein, partial [Pseudoalteromonas sp. GABNS16H]|uniref:hypothetical protein n=1 Tax=Pseudoalteromonas sp. GABNS16H TaxID=3025325 RepID=UPI00235FC7A1